MATSPLGGFADLSSARRRVDARMAADQGLLNSAISGLQQGAALAQFPETIQQDALNRQLSLAVQQAQLDRLKRPQVFQTAGGLLVEDQTNPQGFRTVAAPVATAAPRLGRIIVDQPTGRIFEVTPTGVRERTLTEGALAGVQPSIESDIFDSTAPIVAPAPAAGGVLSPKLPPEVGLKTRNFVQPDGTTHTFSVDSKGNKVADLGISRAAPVLTATQRGEKAPPAELQKQYIGSQNLFQTAPRLESKIAELRKAGVKEPTSFERSIINLAYQDPKGLLSGFATAVATGQIRPEIADLEQLRAEIESNYVTAKAGLSQTASEVKRTIPVAPTRFDSWDRMLSKTKNLREVAGINVANINKQYPTFGKSQAALPPAISFDTEEDIPNDLPIGTPVIVGGREGTWQGP